MLTWNQVSFVNLHIGCWWTAVPHLSGWWWLWWCNLYDEFCSRAFCQMSDVPVSCGEASMAWDHWSKVMSCVLIIWMIAWKFLKLQYSMPLKTSVDLILLSPLFRTVFMKSYCRTTLLSWCCTHKIKSLAWALIYYLVVNACMKFIYCAWRRSLSWYSTCVHYVM
mgnify:CR=1 FL=1